MYTTVIGQLQNLAPKGWLAQIGPWYVERERAEKTGQTRWGAASSHRRARAVSLTFFVSELRHQRCYQPSLTVLYEPEPESLSSSLKEYNKETECKLEKKIYYARLQAREGCPGELGNELCPYRILDFQIWVGVPGSSWRCPLDTLRTTSWCTLLIWVFHLSPSCYP